jgi:hypothetical protein
MSQAQPYRSTYHLSSRSIEMCISAILTRLKQRAVIEFLTAETPSEIHHIEIYVP